MPPRTSTTAHEGFSRSKFSEAYPIPGTAWGQGGVANVQFAGVPLSAVLKKQNVKIDREVKLPTKRQDLVLLSGVPMISKSLRFGRSQRTPSSEVAYNITCLDAPPWDTGRPDSPPYQALNSRSFSS